MAIEKPKAYIFDLDGTLYLDEEMIQGADKTIEWVRKSNSKIRFVTNNPRYSREYYTNKLINMGIDAEKEEVITSANLTAKYLENNSKYGRIFVIGEAQLLRELQERNLSVVEEGNADTVLVSFDTTLTYEKLLKAYHELNKGAHFIATNPDFVCPTRNGGLIDAGAIIAALEVSTGKNVEKVIGKPSALMARIILQQLELEAEECVVVGDRINTDILLGNQAGMKTVWINSNKEQLPTNIKLKPNYTINSIADLPFIIENSSHSC